MSEDRRVSRSPDEPAKSAAAGSHRWTDYLEWLRESAIARVLGMPAHERVARILPSGWSPLEMLNHLLHMEQRWFIWGFLGEAVDQPWGDWNVADPSEPSKPSDPSQPSDGAPEPRWQVPSGVGVDVIAERLRAVGARTSSVLIDFPLDRPARLGGRFAVQPPTLEWICFHVLAEYARHLGQLDVVVELFEAGTPER